MRDGTRIVVLVPSNRKVLGLLLQAAEVRFKVSKVFSTDLVERRHRRIRMDRLRRHYCFLKPGGGVRLVCADC